VLTDFSDSLVDIVLVDIGILGEELRLEEDISLVDIGSQEVHHQEGVGLVGGSLEEDNLEEDNHLEEDILEVGIMVVRILEELHLEGILEEDIQREDNHLVALQLLLRLVGHNPFMVEHILPYLVAFHVHETWSLACNLVIKLKAYNIFPACFCLKSIVNYILFKL
jgi:hypothetical protein